MRALRSLALLCAVVMNSGSLARRAHELYYSHAYIRIRQRNYANTVERERESRAREGDDGEKLKGGGIIGGESCRVFTAGWNLFFNTDIKRGSASERSSVSEKADLICIAATRIYVCKYLCFSFTGKVWGDGAV